MLWNRFDLDRKKLNLYDNPHFEPGTGITNRNALVLEITKLLDAMQGQPHPIIKARAFAFAMDHAAIEVNPIDWFGFNICGWLTPKGVAKHEAQRKAIKGNSAAAADWEHANQWNRDGQGDGAESADDYDIHSVMIHRSPLAPLNARWREEIPLTPEFEAAAAYIEETGAGIFWPDYDHSVPDWESVESLGFPGLLERAKRIHREKAEAGELTEAQEIYYQSVEIEYESLCRLMHRFLDVARRHAGDDEKMPIVIECLEVLCKGAPQTTYQTMTLIYFQHLLQQYFDEVQVRSLGNLDVDLWPYYTKDLEEGRLNRDQAKELFRYYFEKFTNQGHIHAQPVSFGGYDKDGNSLINDLSFIMLEAYDESKLVNPKLILKVMPNTPDAFLRKALDMIRHGVSTIVFINEELAYRTSLKLGRTEEEARNLVGTGCNNFATRGHETVPEHMYVNLAKGIELAFNNGVDPLSGHMIGCETGPVSEMRTFEDFKAAYIKQVECLINKAFIISDFYDSHLLDYNPAPMYSGTMPESLACGRDAYHNGVKYNNTVMFLSCHATAADSLMMVKKYVFDKQAVTLPELKDILSSNWAGHESLRETMLDDPEKFGNDMDEVDNLATSLVAHFSQMVVARKNVRGGHFVVNGESIWFSHRFGEKCGATPDGRMAGDLLSKNMSASIGQDRNGITALIKSVTKIDATTFAYGCPFDYMLHPSAVQGEEGLTAYLGLLRTFMKRGGYGFQGNVLDADTLRDAQKHPENYEYLQVRVCGWNWYFNNMEREFQDEFIRRAELNA